MKNKLMSLAISCVFLIIINNHTIAENMDCNDCDSTDKDTTGLSGWVELIQQSKEVLKPENWVAQPFDHTGISDQARTKAIVQEFTNILKLSPEKRPQRAEAFLNNHSNCDQNKIKEIVLLLKKNTVITESKILIKKIQNTLDGRNRVNIGADNQYVNVSLSPDGDNIIIDNDFNNYVNWLIQ